MLRHQTASQGIIKEDRGVQSAGVYRGQGCTAYVYREFAVLESFVFVSHYPLGQVVWQEVLHFPPPDMRLDGRHLRREDLFILLLSEDL